MALWVFRARKKAKVTASLQDTFWVQEAWERKGHVGGHVPVKSQPCASRCFFEASFESRPGAPAQKRLSLLSYPVLAHLAKHDSRRNKRRTQQQTAQLQNTRQGTRRSNECRAKQGEAKASSLTAEKSMPVADPSPPPVCSSGGASTTAASSALPSPPSSPPLSPSVTRGSAQSVVGGCMQASWG